MSNIEYKVEVYNPEKTPWGKVGKEIAKIERRQFGAVGYTKEDLQYWFEDPRNTAVVMTEANSGRVLGYTFAQPSEDAYNLNREFYIHDLGRRINDDTAYISDTAIHPDYVGQGLVVPLIGLLEQTLREKGYKYIERDAAIDNGYADKIEKVYRRQNRILASSNHSSFMGSQRFFRIRL